MGAWERGVGVVRARMGGGAAGARARGQAGPHGGPGHRRYFSSNRSRYFLIKFIPRIEILN
jgi:hypothetical protein